MDVPRRDRRLISDKRRDYQAPRGQTAEPASVPFAVDASAGSKAQKNPPERVFYGAVNQTNLETPPIFSILEELEEWGKQLKASPEVSRKLREFDYAARGAGMPLSPETGHMPGPRPSGPRR